MAQCQHLQLKVYPPIPIRESSRRVLIFTIKLPMRQLLSPAFMNPDIIAGLVYEHKTVELMVVQGLDERNHLLVFAEGENIEKLCQKLWYIEIWLGGSVYIGCDIATPEQMMLREGLQSVGREENVSGEGANMQLSRLMSEPQGKHSYPSVTSQVVGKMPKISTLSGDPTQKGEVSFEQWVFEVKSVTQSHNEVTLQEGMLQSLHEATATLVQYLGLQALVSEIINKLELTYGTMASFDILMQKFYKLQQDKAEKVTFFVTCLEGALDVVQQEYPMMLSASQVQ